MLSTAYALKTDRATGQHGREIMPIFETTQKLSDRSGKRNHGEMTVDQGDTIATRDIEDDEGVGPDGAD
jgi:hypothetical protein